MLRPQLPRLLAGALALALWNPGLAGAHAFDPIVVLLQEVGPGRFAVHWKLGPGAELQPTLVLPAQCTPARVSAPAASLVDCSPAGLRGSELGVPEVGEGKADAFIRISFLDGEIASGTVHRAAPAWRVPGVSAQNAWGQTAWRYATLGIEHIWLGIDHLLFVLALMLLVPRTRTLVATLTAFTVAHSLTLALAVLDVLRVPPAPVEVLIAGSIVLVAHELTHAADAPPTLARRQPWLVAFLFGLLHGLGFAGALRDIGLPANQLPLALFAFNIGVELGQLAFVGLMLWPVRWWQRRSADSSLLRRAPAYGIGIAAAAWVIERVAAF